MPRDRSKLVQLDFDEFALLRYRVHGYSMYFLDLFFSYKAARIKCEFGADREIYKNISKMDIYLAKLVEIGNAR